MIAELFHNLPHLQLSELAILLGATQGVIEFFQLRGPYAVCLQTHLNMQIRKV